MYKSLIYWFTGFLWVVSYNASAQGLDLATVKKEKDKLLHTIGTVSNDPSLASPVTRLYEREVNGIISSIRTEGKLSFVEKEKALRSLVFFLKELNSYLSMRKMDIYDVPGDLESYKAISKAIGQRQPVLPLLVPLDARRTQLMAAAFTQYPEYFLIDDVAVYKRVSSSPEFILQFLEAKPGFRFTDSLFLDAAAYDPMMIVYYLNRKQSGSKNNFHTASNIYVSQVAALASDKNASELMPFVTQIAENRISREEIIGKRADPLQYFQFLVNTLQEQLSRGRGNPAYQKSIRGGIKQKALSFYVNTINELHSSPEAARFVSVKALRTEDLYYIITSCGDELYTSSYLGLYKRLMENFRDRTADSLFDLVRYDNFRVFIRLAANYNVLGDFLHHLSPGEMEKVLQRFIAGIGNDIHTALERAMDIADCFTSVANDTAVNEVIERELTANLVKSRAARNYPAIRLYGILIDLFNLANKRHDIRALWGSLGNYEILKKNRVENDKGEIIELLLFYGDEDGIASFGNFIKDYSDSSRWRTNRNDKWVSIRSRKGERLIIYANIPLDIADKSDLQAQDSLMNYLAQQGQEPAILVHRGHSYHLEKTIKRLSPSVKLAILGSCGSSNKAISIASINPDIQVIGSKKTGSMSINDPIIETINETLINNQDLEWPDIWKKLETRFQKDKAALSMFTEYFPPGNNLSLFVLKLYNYYKRK